MKITRTVEEGTDYDIELDDVIDYIQCAKPHELKKIAAELKRAKFIDPETVLPRGAVVVTLAFFNLRDYYDFFDKISTTDLAHCSARTVNSVSQLSLMEVVV